MASEFEWMPAESAPKTFPIIVVAGQFLREGVQVAILPDRRVVNPGWGVVDSFHAVGSDRKHLPDHLDIVWFALLENRFYVGRFALPVEKISALFHQGLPSEKGEMRGIDRLLVGLASSSDVSLWVGSGRVVHEVAMFSAVEADLPFNTISDDAAESRTDVVDRWLRLTLGTEGTMAARRHPAMEHAWREAGRRYVWHPIAVVSQPKIMWLKTVNGECDWFKFSGSELLATSSIGPLAVPLEITLEFSDSRGNYQAFINFDGEELHLAYTTLGTRWFGLAMALVIEPAHSANHVDVMLRAGTDSYRFSRHVSRIERAD